MRLLKVFLSSFVLLALNGCVTIPNMRDCSVAGKLSTGMNCADTETPSTYQLDFRETVDFLEPQPERTCVPKFQGMNVCASDQTHGALAVLPKRSGAIMQSADDYAKRKSALEEACRVLGNRCSPEIQQALAQDTVKMLAAESESKPVGSNQPSDPLMP
jgi:hypothetical protein